MAFNPQERLTILNGEDKDIILKCLEFTYGNSEKYGLCAFPYALGLHLLDAYLYKEYYGDSNYYYRIYPYKNNDEQFNDNCIKYNIDNKYIKYIVKFEFNIYVMLYEVSIEQKILGLKYPSEKIKELARYEYLIENPEFRGKPITLNTEMINDIEYSFVSYDGKEYKFDEFLLAMYPNIRMNKSVVYFPDTIDNMLKIGPTQRIRMKYDILAYHFKLPTISDEDKNDLFRFLCKYRNNDKIQKYYSRFKWNMGIEKMVAFGADLDISGKVDGAIEGFWCYECILNIKNVIITGFNTTLQNWIASIKNYLEYVFNDFQSDNEIPNIDNIEFIRYKCRILLYYQQGKRVALPDIQIGRPIKEVIDNCIDTLCRKMEKDISANITDIIDKCFSTLSIPDYQSESYQFTVDFEKDVMIVDTKSAARAQQAIEQVYTTAAERLTGLKAGDKITTQQLRDRGYKNNNGKAINTLVEYGILKKGVLRGNYVIQKDF